MKVINGTSTYIIETCCTCFMEFGMTKELYDKRQADKKEFTCPNGHSQYYQGETAEVVLRRQLREKENQVESLKKQLRKKRIKK